MTDNSRRSTSPNRGDKHYQQESVETSGFLHREGINDFERHRRERAASDQATTSHADATASEESQPKRKKRKTKVVPGQEVFTLDMTPVPETIARSGWKPG